MGGKVNNENDKEYKLVSIDRLGYEVTDVICEWSDGKNI